MTSNGTFAKIDAQTALNMAKVEESTGGGIQTHVTKPSFVKCICCWLPNIVKEQRSMDSAFLRAHKFQNIKSNKKEIRKQ